MLPAMPCAPRWSRPSERKPALILRAELDKQQVSILFGRQRADLPQCRDLDGAAGPERDGEAVDQARKHAASCQSGMVLTSGSAMPLPCDVTGPGSPRLMPHNPAAPFWSRDHVNSASNRWSTASADTPASMSS